jgi:hypothetical protein
VDATVVVAAQRRGVVQIGLPALCPRETVMQLGLARLSRTDT